MVNISVAGNLISDVEEGVSTTTTSSGANFEISMKKVTSRKAKSTMGVMSREGLERCGLTLGIYFISLNVN
jgi:hypothetical protein